MRLLSILFSWVKHNNASLKVTYLQEVEKIAAIFFQLRDQILELERLFFLGIQFNRKLPVVC